MTPSPIHAGGLRFHGMSTIISELYDQGMMEAVAYQQYNDGTMTDYIPTDEDLAEALKCVPPQPEE